MRTPTVQGQGRQAWALAWRQGECEGAVGDVGQGRGLLSPPEDAWPAYPLATHGSV